MLGHQISACFEFVSKVGQEVNNLNTLIPEAINRMLGEPELAEVYASLSWDEDDACSDDNWVGTDTICSIPLIIKPKRKATLYLGYQISLMGAGINAGGNKVPLIHVFCWSYGAGSFPDCSMMFPLGAGEQELDDQSLFVFKDEPGAPRSWTYSLDLTVVNTLDDVERLIIKPMRKLLLNASGREAFTGNAKGVVCYEEIADEPGQYTVSIRDY